ncbi:MAG: hypothetical protein P9F19_03330 [Candidatus Contendobacter sp.]|nr:hypothetical protein [Candidatus Contendobacter sp.]MDG4556418.1 hypothetical protein [Candidatus Contendobacter sp.]
MAKLQAFVWGYPASFVVWYENPPQGYRADAGGRFLAQPPHRPKILVLPGIDW